MDNGKFTVNNYCLYCDSEKVASKREQRLTYMDYAEQVRPVG